MLLIIPQLYTLVPACPHKVDGILCQFSQPSEKYPQYKRQGRRELPQEILVLLADFPDQEFDLVADYPDSLAHDAAYFERLFFHVASYFRDASYGIYEISQENFLIWEQVFTLPQDMSYYGDDEYWTERIAEFAVDLVMLADPDIDFTQYDAFFVVHAGAGQEADITGNNEEELWSTFLTRRSLQAGLDPENDDFPGIWCNDGIYLTEFVICPEAEWQPDLGPNDPIYGVMGVYCHQFGHQIGLPTLYDNDSSNGSSGGIGGFGLMGTALWNANGFVPSLPCAWTRCYLGWEDENLLLLESDQVDQAIVFPHANDEDTPRVYQAKISDKEYFLLENRQQNPDGSTWNGEATFTFQLLPPGEQDIYPPGHPYAGQPKFNFMENTYEGCEWDFYLPGLGGPDEPVIDGSGLLIWHIDENIIEANFDPEFESNSVNGDAAHKGVDLEEADGVQHMDVNNTIYSRGSAKDAYREGNNDYFGKMYLENGELHLPAADSYYGGNQLEIYEISASDSLMAFSISFDWNLNTGYVGENIYPAAVVDFDDDGDTEIFYPMPDGELYLWDDFELVTGFPVDINFPLSTLYAYNERDRTFLVPYSHEEPQEYAGLFLVNQDYQEPVFPPYLERRWAAGPLVIPGDDPPYSAVVPMEFTDGSGSEINFLDENYEVVTAIAMEDTWIISNLIYKNGILRLFCKTGEGYYLHSLNIIDMIVVPNDIDVFPDSTLIHSAVLADINCDQQDEIIVTTVYPDTLVYVFNQAVDLLPGFPVGISLHAISFPSLADVDGNGCLDIIIGGENSFLIINKNGDTSGPSQSLSSPDSLFLAAGVMALDLDNDAKLEIAGNMSRNRLTVWENINNNDFEINYNYPISFGQRSRSLPIIDTSDNTLFMAADNGYIYRQQYDWTLFLPTWHCELGNLQRTSSYLGNLPINEYITTEIFIKEETYIYPNPYSSIFNSTIVNGREEPGKIALRIMTSADTRVEIKIFDIAGNIIHKNKIDCQAYLKKSLLIPAEDFSSGIYFALLKTRGKVMKLNFAVEK